MQYTIGKIVGGSQVCGLHVSLGGKETIAKSINIKPEDWETWSGDIKTKLKELGDAENAAPENRHEVAIETSDGIQYMDVSDIKDLICVA